MPLRSQTSEDHSILFRIISLSLLPLLLLSVAANAQLDKLGPELSGNKSVTQEKLKPLKPKLSDKTQAFLNKITTADTALGEARKYQENGQFGLAKLVLQHGLRLTNISDIESSLLANELHYAMPVLQAKELLVTGMPDEAEVILDKLADVFSADRKRTDEILALRGTLAQSRFLASARRDNEQDVTRDVRQRMNVYYRKHGAFPAYVELNRLLPSGDKILQNFEIIYFKSVPNAYRMVLRNLHNKDNLLKIEATGLMK